MLKMLTRLIGEDIALVWQSGANLWRVRVDPAQVEQVLVNLAVNARDAIAGVGKLAIETDAAEIDDASRAAHPGFVSGRYVRLTVSDDGCGMDDETRARIFEPFFTTKPQGKGTGLGLATVYGIMKQIGGFIDVRSQPGQGTTFAIYLPAQESEAAAALADTRGSADVPAGSETVLLVEDEAALLRLSKRMLQQLGYTVLAAGGPTEAIELVKTFAGEIHLLMTDVVMPVMSGRDLQRALDVLRPGLKCLFTSGYTADIISQHGVLDEGIHFLQKPFSKRALGEKIREACGDGSTGP